MMGAFPHRREKMEQKKNEKTQEVGKNVVKAAFTAAMATFKRSAEFKPATSVTIPTFQQAALV